MNHMTILESYKHETLRVSIQIAEWVVIWLNYTVLLKYQIISK